MTAADSETQSAPRRKGLMLPVGAGLVLAGVLAAGGYVLAPTLGFGPAATPAKKAIDTSSIAFVPIEQMLVPVGPASDRRYLRFAAQIEVPQKQKPAVETLLPRVVDVLNGYLRALTPADLADPAALFRLRGQMLHRIKVVVGEDAVRDLLIMEFVLS